MEATELLYNYLVFKRVRPVLDATLQLFKLLEHLSMIRGERVYVVPVPNRGNVSHGLIAGEFGHITKVVRVEPPPVSRQSGRLKDVQLDKLELLGEGFFGRV